MILLLALAAHAQDVDGWSPSGGVVLGRGAPDVESASVRAGDRGFGLLGAVASDAGPAGSGAEVLVPLVLAGGYALGDAARIDLQLPFYANVRADDAGFSGAALGDVRLGAVVPLYRGTDWGIAVVPRIGLPTGTSDARVSRGLRGTLLATLEGEAGRVGGGVQLGPTIAERREIGADSASGSSFDGAAAGWWRPTGAMKLGLEGGGSAGLAGAASAGHLDVFAAIAHPSGLGLLVSAGGGGGLGPASRVVAAVTWAAAGGADADRDGVADSDDGCREDAEDRDGFDDADGCPDPDDDGDGVADVDDRCVAVPEDRDGTDDADGCPDPDDDGDGVPDREDRCPKSAGPAEQGGCNDLDGDGLDDAVDACPGKPGPKDELSPDGCPKDAWITAKGVAVAHPIAFEISGNFADGSGDVVVAVALLLLEHPELPVLEVGAHVHTGYGDAAQGLSRSRAERVRAAIVAAGVPPERVVAKAYGSSAPIDTNRTTTGRARNERIELVFRPPEAPEAPPR